MTLEQNASPVRPARRRFAAFVSMELALDLAERLAVLLLFLLFVHRMLPRLVDLVLIERVHPELILLAAGTNAQALLLVIGESLGVALILVRRRSASLSSHPFDWALSFSAVSAPLLLTTPAPASTVIPELLVTTLMLAGLLVQISGKLALARSFGLVPANRGVKTPGFIAWCAIRSMPATRSPISASCSASPRCKMPYSMPAFSPSR